MGPRASSPNLYKKSVDPVILPGSQPSYPSMQTKSIRKFEYRPLLDFKVQYPLGYAVVLFFIHNDFFTLFSAFNIFR